MTCKYRLDMLLSEHIWRCTFKVHVTGASSALANSEQNVIRGRVKDQSKSATFNQLWTAEEQKRLEELLIECPPEPVERHRWVKIANALGNRTPIQVASRVQKYFIKLAKAGLPIPGRMPNVAHYRTKSQRPHQRMYNRFYQAPSTFMTSYQPPVYMSDDDGDSASMFGGSSEDMEDPRMMNQFGDEEEEISDEEAVPVHLRDSEEYQELLRLKKLKRVKMNLDHDKLGQRQHAGYKCDRCGCEPIVGVRFHCIDCPEDTAVDFCEGCVDSSFETGQHSSSHRLDPVRLPYTTPFIDRDYTKFTKEGYNYLDPNFMPAT
ncbi:ZZ-type zinc finger-containing protein 3-like [Lingula anatina]|uniref:ZZ-type zinc finger-containing protein 3-like n=1 Tax=Lingula anatina TaxID=7574 RepID=A0A1S3KAR9_LINAN|nr:ZZ-type zinc finger-containing protein 3-like [Lingula anatina]|eukprot:XP_013419738.1 ZZ-type zinc finger-containing protein 3-like [Lingula anatina]